MQFNIERKVSEQRKVKKIRKGVKQRDLVATYGEKLLKCISFNFSTFVNFSSNTSVFYVYTSKSRENQGKRKN